MSPTQEPDESELLLIRQVINGRESEPCGLSVSLSTEHFLQKDLCMQLVSVSMCCTTALPGWEFDVMPTKYSHI